MDPVALHQFLALYSWFPLVAILAFMLLIGRFYQRFSGERTYFWLFVLPMVLFGAASVRYAGQRVLFNDPVTALVSLVAGLVLVALVLRLHQRMMRDKLGDDADDGPDKP
jgi:hypothetical protein